MGVRLGLAGGVMGVFWGLHELEPQGSYVQFRRFSAGSGLPNLREPRPDPNSNPNGVADPNTYICSTPRRQRRRQQPRQPRRLPQHRRLVSANT